MASAEIVLECGLKICVGCQDRLCVNLDADEALALRECRYVRKCYLTVVKKVLVPNLLCNFWFKFVAG